MQLNEDIFPGHSRSGNDNAAPPKPRGLTEDLVMSIRFFSRLPLGEAPHIPPDLSRIALALPFASILIGALPALVLFGLTLLGLPSYFAAALAVAASVVITGGMAEDGLADAADGLFGGRTRERRLEIMKDSRHGTYGVSALCLLLVLRVAALGSIAAANPLGAAAIWLAATVMARSGAIWLSVALPPARPDGASASAGRARMGPFLIGGVFALLLSFVFVAPAAGLVPLAIALVLAGAVCALWARLCRKLVGGQTGDLIGALQALIEIAALTGLLMG